MFVSYYTDMETADGSPKSKLVKHYLGNLRDMSVRAAKREMATIMAGVNEQRGSAAPVVKGQTFGDALKLWRQAIAPNLSPATVRQRESYLRVHITPIFDKMPLREMDVQRMQQFGTDLKRTVKSSKTILNILGSIFSILAYAEKCKMRTPKVSFRDLTLAKTMPKPSRFFTQQEAMDIIGASPEPFKTIFALCWFTGCRAGEILALTITDIDFNRRMIHITKSNDDATRIPRCPKTTKSAVPVPIPTELEAILRAHIARRTPNQAGILFATPRNSQRPRSRANVVRVGLRPVLKRLGIPQAGLHAFRHGLATALGESSAPFSVVKGQLRHSDIKTTLGIYTHLIPQSQRDAMELVGNRPIITPINTLLKFASN
jgi:integrase